MKIDQSGERLVYYGQTQIFKGIIHILTLLIKPIYNVSTTFFERTIHSRKVKKNVPSIMFMYIVATVPTTVVYIPELKRAIDTGIRGKWEQAWHRYPHARQTKHFFFQFHSPYEYSSYISHILRVLKAKKL